MSDPRRATGSLRKMRGELTGGAPVSYRIPVGDAELPLNPALGGTLRLAFTGEIRCVHCDRKIKKTYNQGYCFPCCQKLARCDMCIVKPERCHYAAGTCREPAWGEQHCLIPHTVYLANSSGVKVGITRSHQRRTRWVDQGAVQARPILTVGTRLDAGKVEVALAEHVADKTNWRAMLKGDIEPQDLEARADELLAHVPADVPTSAPEADGTVEIVYPVLEHPRKIVSGNLDKHPVFEGTLLGIKGQYLILDSGVLNVRKYGGYHVELTLEPSAAGAS